MQKRSMLILISILIAILSLSLLLSGCGAKSTTAAAKSSPCKVNSDCKTTQACKTPYCSQGFCALKIKDNCCGNGICEDTFGENKCLCAADCGSCNGSITITTGKTTVTSQYLTKGCDKNKECTAIFDSNKAIAKENLNQFKGTNFGFNLYLGYANPFDLVGNDFSLELKLTDIDPLKIKPPIKINEVRILDGTSIMGRTQTSLEFNKVGDSSKIIMHPNYNLDQQEETKSSLQVNIDYEYIPLTAKTDPTTKATIYVEGQPERLTYKYTLSDKVTFVDLSFVNP